jgi:hypothetical protein
MSRLRCTPPASWSRFCWSSACCRSVLSCLLSDSAERASFRIGSLMPIGMAGIAGTLQYPVALVLSGLALLASFGFAGLKLLKAPSEALSVAAPV